MSTATQPASIEGLEEDAPAIEPAEENQTLTPRDVIDPQKRYNRAGLRILLGISAEQIERGAAQWLPVRHLGQILRPPLHVVRRGYLALDRSHRSPIRNLARNRADPSAGAPAAESTAGRGSAVAAVGKPPTWPGAFSRIWASRERVFAGPDTPQEPRQSHRAAYITVRTAALGGRWHSAWTTHSAEMHPPCEPFWFFL